MKYLVCLFVILFSLACQTMDTSSVDIHKLIEGHTTKVRPDKRTALFTIEAEKQNGTFILSGETTNLEAKEILLQEIDKKGIAYIDSVQVLPSAELGDKIFGIVRLSVCNIRSQPKHSGELSTQALMGNLLRILKKQGDWYYVQTPNDYLGWLDKAAIHFINQKEWADWKAKPKAMITDNVVYAKNENQIVSDLVAGNILIMGTTMKNGQQEIMYPDGRTAYVPANSLSPFEETKRKHKTSSGESILEDAQRFIGTPYLWGGTSAKGFDCSGFTKTVYYLNGIQLERDASLQVHNGIKIDTDKSLKNLEKGDLLFFGRKTDNPDKPKVTHVAIYMGDGKIIHAAGEVKIESLDPDDPLFAEDRLNSFLSARRILGSNKNQGVPNLEEISYY